MVVLRSLSDLFNKNKNSPKLNVIYVLAKKDDKEKKKRKKKKEGEKKKKAMMDDDADDLCSALKCLKPTGV